MQDICRIVLCIYLFFGRSFVLFVVQKNADLAIEIATFQILFFMWMWMQFKLNLNILKAWIVNVFVIYVKFKHSELEFVNVNAVYVKFKHSKLEFVNVNAV
jgi:hypothetical protein